MTIRTLSPTTRVKIGHDTYELTQEAMAELIGRRTKKQKTYLLKAACPECDYTIRITRKHIAAGGLPACPSCSDYDTGYIVPMALEADDD